MDKNRRKKISSSIFSALLITLTAFTMLFSIKTTPKGKDNDSDYSWTKYNLVAHALGGIDNHGHVNTKEAFIHNYNKGLRVFEVDFQLTSDNHLVLLHDWGWFHKITNEEGNSHPVSFDEFKKRKIHNKFQPSSIEDLIDLLIEYKDAYIITDSKYLEQEAIKQEFNQLVSVAKQKDESVLDRFIIQIYDKNMFETVMNIHKFKSTIYALYMCQGSTSDEEAINFCIKNGIKAISFDTTRATPEFLAKIKSARLHSYIHTVNDIEEIKNYLSLGATGIYQDFVAPCDIDN